MAPSFRPPLLRLEQFADTTVAQVNTAALGETQVQAVAEDLDRLVQGRTGLRLQLDLRQVRFLASTALGVFLALHKRLQAAGGHLVLAGVHGLTAEVFRVTRLDTILEIRRAAEALPPSGAARLAS